MRVFITAAAINDVAEIRDFIGQDNEAAAARFVDQLFHRCKELADAPHIGRKRNYIALGIRTISEAGYMICYRVVEDEIQIVAVIHGARKWESLLSARES